MGWILTAAAIGIVVLVGLQAAGRGRRPVSIGLLVVLAAASGFFWWRGRALESELTTAVRALTGDAAIHVECQGFWREFRLDNNLGEVAFDGAGGLSKKAELRGSVCSELRGWLGSDKSNPSRDQLIAVHVLSHEAMHALGTADEARTECLAMQFDERLALLLGASPDQARELADRYWREVFPRMPNQYRGVECRPDGGLDLSPGDDLWPGKAEEASSPTAGSGL